MISRRAFMLVLGATTLSTSGMAVAQQRQKIFRVGLLHSEHRESAASRVAAFVDGLRQLGYVEGRNIVIEQRYADGNPEVLNKLAQELSRKQVDVILAPNSLAIEAARRASPSTPIVFTNAGDPVGTGFAASLAHPGGNITGMTNITPELVAKRLQLLKEAFPAISRMVVMVSEGFDVEWPGPVQGGAKALGIQVLPVSLLRRADMDTEIEKARKWRADSVYVVSGPTTTRNRTLLAEFALKLRAPAIGGNAEFVEAAGLMSYGANFDALYHRAAMYVDRILKGTKPGDLPIEQPTRFELVVNMKTAKALGLVIPQPFLMRADRVIE